MPRPARDYRPMGHQEEAEDLEQKHSLMGMGSGDEGVGHSDMERAPGRPGKRLVGAAVLAAAALCGASALLALRGLQASGVGGSGGGGSPPSSAAEAAAGPVSPPFVLPIAAMHETLPASSSANKNAVAANKQKLYEMEDIVMKNKFEAYEHRSIITENRYEILHNYAAAFKDNRQLALINLHKIFQNRKAILESTPSEGSVQEHWKGSMLNKAKLDYLEIRSQLTSHMVNASSFIAEANKHMMAANAKIIEGNARISEFNAKQSGINSQLLDGSLKPADATPESNAKRVAANEATIAEVEKQAAANTKLMAENLELAKKNEVNLEANAKLIEQRRAAIEKNHASMEANSHTIASMVGSSGASSEHGATGNASVSQAYSEANGAYVKSNSRGIFELETTVEDQRFKAYEHRAMIVGNRNLILENYDEAFMGNRQMANFNTLQIFENREAILKSLAVDGAVQDNWKNSMLNEAKADFLQHRSSLNGHVAEVNKMLAAANEKMIAANQKILESNELVTHMNAKHLGINTKLFNGTLKASDASVGTNADRIASNSKRNAEIQKHAAAIGAIILENLKVARENREAIMKNSVDIEKHRETIRANHAKHLENSKKIADMMA